MTLHFAEVIWKMATKTDKNVADKKFRYVLGTYMSYNVCLYITREFRSHPNFVFEKRKNI